MWEGQGRRGQSGINFRVLQSEKKSIYRTISKLWETGWFKHRKNKNTDSELKINYLKSVKAGTLS